MDGRVREPRGLRERRRREDDGPGAEERAVAGGGRGAMRRAEARLEAGGKRALAHAGGARTTTRPRTEARILS